MALKFCEYTKKHETVHITGQILLYVNYITKIHCWICNSVVHRKIGLVFVNLWILSTMHVYTHTKTNIQSNVNVSLK